LLPQACCLPLPKLAIIKDKIKKCLQHSII
jgi:hypothetical protein